MRPSWGRRRKEGEADRWAYLVEEGGKGGRLARSEGKEWAGLAVKRKKARKKKKRSREKKIGPNGKIGKKRFSEFRKIY